MKKNLVPFDPALRDGYIPAPYVLEEGDSITDFYLELDEADRIRMENYEGAKKAAYKACQKEVVLAKVKGGSYAYCDADGNYYRSGFGLRY